MKNFLNRIRRIKFDFSIPNKVDIFLVDEDYAKLKFKKDIKINKKEKNKLNIFVLFLSFFELLFFKKKNLSDAYFFKFIEVIKPKVVIGHELNPDIFRVKTFFPYIKTIIYQLADQSELFKKTSPLMLSANEKYDLKSDFFLSKNEYSRKFYNFIKSNHIIVGSVKNNEIELFKQEKIYDVLFISQFRNKIENYYNTNNNIGSMRTIDSGTAYLLRILNELYDEYKTKIAISLVSNRDDKKYKIDKSFIEDEKNFFSRGLTNFSYENISSYEIANKSKIIITINSTIGYDLLARGMKVIFFDLFNFLGGSPLDGIASKEEEGFFWYKGTDPKIIKEKIKQSIKMGDLEWQNKIDEEKNFFFDPKNKTLKNLINKTLSKY